MRHMTVKHPVFLCPGMQSTALNFNGSPLASLDGSTVLMDLTD